MIGHEKKKKKENIAGSLGKPKRIERSVAIMIGRINGSRSTSTIKSGQKQANRKYNRCNVFDAGNV